MTATLKQNFKTGDLTIPKGTKGNVKAVSNSEHIKKQYVNQEHPDDWFYIMEFPSFPECICDVKVLEFS